MCAHTHLDATTNINTMPARHRLQASFDTRPLLGLLSLYMIHEYYLPRLPQLQIIQRRNYRRFLCRRQPLWSWLVMLVLLFLFWLFPDAERTGAAAAMTSVLHSGHQPWCSPSSHSSIHFDNVVIQGICVTGESKKDGTSEGKRVMTTPHSATTNCSRDRAVSNTPRIVRF